MIAEKELEESEANMICVGGPMHGQRKQVEAGRTWWECVERPRIVAGYYIASENPDEVASIEYKRHVYEREVIGAGRKAITFWRHSEMPIGQVAYYLLNDLSDNEPYTRIATLEWALEKVKDIATHRDDYKHFMNEQEKALEILKLVNAALRPSPKENEND